MAETSNRYSLLQSDTDSESGTDECECDSWVEEKEAALKAYFITQKINPAYCRGCAFLFYSKMYDFLYSSTTLMNPEMFARIMEAYKDVLDAFRTMNPKKKYFSQEFYELLYKKVTSIVIQRKGKLMGGFASAFHDLHNHLTNTLSYCGGLAPPKLLAHQNFDKKQ